MVNKWCSRIKAYGTLEQKKMHVNEPKSWTLI